MPLFEYECESCQTIFEELVSSDRHKINCSNCQSTEVKRLLSVFAAASKSSNMPTPRGAPVCSSGFS